MPVFRSLSRFRAPVASPSQLSLRGKKRQIWETHPRLSVRCFTRVICNNAPIGGLGRVALEDFVFEAPPTIWWYVLMSARKTPGLKCTCCKSWRQLAVFYYGYLRRVLKTW